MKKITALAFTALFITGCTTNLISSSGPYDDFARCLTSKGVKMYGSDTCPHCKAQKGFFKGSFGLVDYVECGRNADICQKAGIQAYPTWEVNGKKFEGETSLSALSEKSGCPLAPTN